MHPRFILFSPPARWGSLDFDKGATPFLHSFLLLPSLDPVFFLHCGVTSPAPDPVGHAWTRMPERMPDRMSEWMPDRMPERRSEKNTHHNRLPESMSEQMSDRMPERMSDKMPERISDISCHGGDLSKQFRHTHIIGQSLVKSPFTVSPAVLRSCGGPFPDCLIEASLKRPIEMAAADLVDIIVAWCSPKWEGHHWVMVIKHG